MLDEKTNDYFASIFKDGENFGLSVVDVSTGEFYVSEITGENNAVKLIDELSRVNPREILINQSAELEQKLIGLY